jgi:two-component system, OmpR family, alkaline phosphatase synthesis response regulator PhoP
MNFKAIVVEDDKEIASLVSLHLSESDIEVVRFDDGKAGLEFALSHPFDIMILDISLPGLNGMDVCKRLRSNGIKQPIILLTARAEEVDKILGLEYGADDYVTKPFSIRELMARIRALLRRMEMIADESSRSKAFVKFGDLEIDFESRKVQVKGERVDLTKKEFELLAKLSLSPGKSFTRQELLNDVWGKGYEGYEHTVNSHINRLRKKIEINPDAPQYVLTSWGTGYRFNEG